MRECGLCAVRPRRRRLVLLTDGWEPVESFGFLASDLDLPPAVAGWDCNQPVFVLRAPLGADHPAFAVRVGLPLVWGAAAGGHSKSRWDAGCRLSLRGGLWGAQVASWWVVRCRKPRWNAG